MQKKIVFIIAIIAIAHFTINWAISSFIGAQVGHALGTIMVETQNTKDLQALEKKIYTLKEKTEKLAWVQQAFSLPLGPLWDSLLQEKHSKFMADIVTLKSENDMAYIRNKILIISLITTFINAFAFAILAVSVIALSRNITGRIS